jgi:hypothetical protein
MYSGKPAEFDSWRAQALRYIARLGLPEAAAGQDRALTYADALVDAVGPVQKLARLEELLVSPLVAEERLRSMLAFRRNGAREFCEGFWLTHNRIPVDQRLPLHWLKVLYLMYSPASSGLRRIFVEVDTVDAMKTATLLHVGLEPRRGGGWWGWRWWW